MRSYVAVSIFALSASVLSAPTPQLGLENTVGSVAGTLGTGNILQGNEAANNEAVTDGLLGNDVDLSGLTGILKNGKRQVNVVGGLTRPVGGLVDDVTKIRVVGNARRQLNLPAVGAVTGIVDGVTGSLNTNGAVNGLKTDVHSKRQLNVPVVSGVTGTLDRVTGSLNTNGAVNGLNTDLHSRQLNVPVVSGVTGTLDRVTGSLNTNGAVNGLNTDLHSRQLNVPVVPGALGIVDNVTGKLNTNGAVDGLNTDLHSRQLNVPVVSGVTGTLDRVTGSLNTNGAVNGLNTDLHSRQLNVPVVSGVTGTLDRVTGSLNTNGAVDGLNTDLHNKRQSELVNDVAGVATGTVGGILDGVAVGVNVKRALPVVQDLPVAGGVTTTLDNAPVVGGVTETVHGVTGDLDPVTSTVFDLVEPVTELTKVVDVRSAKPLDLDSTVGSVSGLENSVLGKDGISI